MGSVEEVSKHSGTYCAIPEPFNRPVHALEPAPSGADTSSSSVMSFLKPQYLTTGS